MKIWIEVPIYRYEFKLDSGCVNITVKSTDIDADYVWNQFCEKTNFPKVETPEYDCVQIGTNPVEFEF